MYVHKTLQGTISKIRQNIKQTKTKTKKLNKRPIKEAEQMCSTKSYLSIYVHIYTTYIHTNICTYAYKNTHLAAGLAKAIASDTQFSVGARATSLHSYINKTLAVSVGVLGGWPTI